MLDLILWGAQAATSGAAIGFWAGMVVQNLPPKWGNGRHISRPLVRRVGLSTVLTVQTVFAIAALPVLILGYPEGSIIFNLWIIDDILTGHDPDKPRKDRSWAKVKLRMPKPIKLRPAEQWVPG